MKITKKYKTLEEALKASDELGGGGIATLTGKGPVISKLPTPVYDFIPGLFYASLRFFGYKPKKYVVTYEDEKK